MVGNNEREAGGDASQEQEHPKDVARLALFYLDNASDGVAWIKPDASFFYANDAFCRSLGYSREELLSMKVYDIDPDFPRERWSDHWAELKQHRHLAFESRHRTKCGRVFPVEISANFMEFDGKECNCAIAHDISKRKQAEEKLRESEEMFRRLFDQSPIGAAIGSPDFGFCKVNEEACRITGYSEEELASMQFADLTHPDDVEVEIQQAKLLVEGKIDEYRMDKRLIRKNGSIVWVRLSVRTVKDAHGNAMYFLPMMYDITELKRAEHLLKDFTESVVDNVPAIIVTVDKEARIQRFNKFAQDLMGYTEDEVRGSICTEVFAPPGDRERVRCIVQSILDGETEKGSESYILAKDGREIPTQWHSSPLRDNTGEIVGAVAIGIDITNLRQKEEQLRQAAKMEAIGRLAGGVAHDLNNYLATIKGYGDLLLQSISGEDASREPLEEISKAVDRAAQLVRQLLAFGRKAFVQPCVINFNRILDDMAAPLEQMLGEDIRFVLERPPDLGNVKADLGQVQQIIMNLTINARDAMPRGGRVIIKTANIERTAADVRQHPGADPGAYVMLSVRDNGRGMTPETIEHIFEPFFTTKPDGTGTGLGLATVYGIVKQSGGHITVESSPSLGTTFKVFLPRVEEEEEIVDEPIRQPAPSKGSTTGTETLLVVEDDESVRNLLVRILERAGYTILDTNGGGEAILKVINYREPIHLLITDVVMPDMNGPELADKLRLLRPKLPVLYTSGYSRDALAERDPLGPDTDLILKPFAPKELCERVRQAIEAAGQD